MAKTQSRKMFVSLPVNDLARSKEFFTKLGFEFNPKFTDENAACMIIGEGAYAMLLTTTYFKTFTKKEPCNSRTHTEGIFALSCSSRAEVDELTDKALAAGGKRAQDPVDHGFMYNCSFYDLDDHHWEVLWMDPKAVES